MTARDVTSALSFARNLRALAAALALVGVQAGCDGGGGDGETTEPPRDLRYLVNPAVCTRGQAYGQMPSVSGGVVESWSVSPPLPSGLALDPANGTISGTPTLVTPQAVYTVTAANAGGSTTVDLALTVNDVLPNIAYPIDPAVYTKGVPIAENVPSNTGGAVVSWSVSPALPAGLALSATTGVISGTPTAVAASRYYSVHATNSGGTRSIDIDITVKDVEPAGLAYSTNPAVYTAGVAIAPNVPSSTGGSVVAYSVSPPLPGGLTLSSATAASTHAAADFAEILESWTWT